MNDYALISTTPLKFIRYVSTDDVDVKNGFKIVPVIKESQPEHDTTNEKLEKTTLLTENSLTQTWNIIPKTEQEIKQQEYRNSIMNGYEVDGLGITLALEESDVNKFSNLLAHINESVRAGYKTEDDYVKIKDINGNIHLVTIAQYRSIILGYGQYLSTLWEASK